MTRTLALFASIGVLGIACNEYEIVQEDKYESVQNESLAPDIAVDPTEIDFGSVYVDGVDEGETPPASLTETITVLNEGEGPLQISDIYFSGDVADTAAFEIGAITSPLIQPGGTATFYVTFSPDTSGNAGVSVLIDSNDPDESTVEVVLIGEGIAPVIDVTPTEFDFGTLYIGCDTTQQVTISNVGNAPLEISNLTLNTGSTDLTFASDLIGNLPYSINEGGSVTVDVTYEPFDDYSDISYLVVESNDPYTPQVTAVQEGAGEYYGIGSDIYEQPIRGQTDIIFAVDRSCSMYDDIENVQNNFGTFTTTMAGLDADYHIAATVEDDGCINGSDLYIDNTFTASQAADTITTMINLGASYGSNTERAFMLLESCLAESLGSSGCNYGLVRDDATLNLIGVSDEPEQSTQNYSVYVAAFQSLKDNPDDVILHAIGGDYPSGCSTASAYTGYYEATVATGGLFLSICSTSYASSLETLAEGSAQDLSSFELSDWPVPETIVVIVDGVTTTVGWEYNAVDNAIDFESDYVPEGGSTIEIEYALFGDCDL